MFKKTAFAIFLGQTFASFFLAARARTPLPSSNKMKDKELKIATCIPMITNKGIGPMVGNVCLPMLIFRNIAKLDMSTVDYRVVSAVAIVKVVSALLAAIMSYVGEPKDVSKIQRGDGVSNYGMFTLFCTGSNDLALHTTLFYSSWLIMNMKHEHELIFSHSRYSQDGLCLKNIL